MPPCHYVFKNSVLISFQTLYARIHNFVIPNLSTLNSGKKKAPNEKKVQALWYRKDPKHFVYPHLESKFNELSIGRL